GGDRGAQVRGGGGERPGGELRHAGVFGGAARRDAGGGGEPGGRARRRAARPHCPAQGTADGGAAGAEGAPAAAMRNRTAEYPVTPAVNTWMAGVPQRC